MENITNIGILKVQGSHRNILKFEDENLIQEITSAFTNSIIKRTTVVKSDRNIVESTLKSWIPDFNGILTMGGIGNSDDDIVPEATKAVIEKDLTGFVHPQISKSFEQAFAAAMSRITCGITSKCLILNLPGNVNDAEKCFSELKTAIASLINEQENLNGNCKSKVNLETLKETSNQMRSVDEAMKLMYQEILPTLEHETISVKFALNRIIFDNITVAKSVQNNIWFPIENSTVIGKGHKITEEYISILPLCGHNKVKVFKRPQISVITIGAKIKSLDEQAESKQFYDTNKILLRQKLQKYCYNSTDGGIANCPNSLKALLEKELLDHNVIVASGGVSMKERNFLKHVLIEDFGAIVHFEKVNTKRGGTVVIFATLQFRQKIKYVFGLPGNPKDISATFLLFVVPALRFMERNINYKFPEVMVDPGSTSCHPYCEIKIGTEQNQLVCGTGTSFVINGLVIENCKTGFYTCWLTDY